MKKITYTFMAVLALFFSCADQDERAVRNAPDLSPSNDVLAYIKSLGIRSEDIVEHDEYYVAEEDIIFPKNMIVPDENARQEQYYTGSVISFANRANVRIKIDPSMTSSPDMTTEINSAVTMWNNLRYHGSGIRLSIVTGTYDILISNSNLGSGVCGQGTFPSGGAAGGTIYIHKSYISGNSFDQRVRTITHEIGHCISFRHTNWSAQNESTATPVPGVGGTDANSLMNGGQCGSGAVVLSTNDRNATIALYPTASPYGMSNSGNYPWTFYWNTPLYTDFGPLVNYEVKHIRYDYQGNPNTSASTFQTTTSYVLPYTAGQYSGQGCVVYVRAYFTDGTISGWSTYNCTL